MKLIATKELVKKILEENPKARDSDMLLYCEVCKALNDDALGKPFYQVILDLEKLGLPPFESVRRSRQKVQAEFPELAASPEIQVFRSENEEKYRKFAIGEM